MVSNPRPFRDAEKTAVDVLLEGVTVAEPLVLPPVVDVWAAAGAADPWARARPDRWASDPWAAAKVDPWAAASSPTRTAVLDDPFRWVKARLHGTRPRPQVTIVLTVERGRPTPGGGVLWLPAKEFYDCYEYEWDDSVLPPGGVLGLSEAAESAHDTGECGNDDSDYFLYGVPINGEVETHQPCDCVACEEFGPQPELLEHSRILRADLVAEPDEFASSLKFADLHLAREWAGLRHTPSREEVLYGILTDPLHGVGAAALDCVLWNHPEDYGRSGEHMWELLENVERSVYIRRAPVESFILHEDDLHHGTELVKPRWASAYMFRLFGDYVIDRVEYTSDPTMTVLCGWRSLWLRPGDDTDLPDFAKG